MTKYLEVVNEKCPQNHPCPAVRVCPVRALTQVGFSAPKVDIEKCIACGKCSNFCPKNALVLHGQALFKAVMAVFVLSQLSDRSQAKKVSVTFLPWQGTRRNRIFLTKAFYMPKLYKKTILALFEIVLLLSEIGNRHTVPAFLKIYPDAAFKAE